MRARFSAVVIPLSTELPLHPHPAGVGEPVGEVHKIPLHDAEFQLLPGADVLPLAEGVYPVGEAVMPSVRSSSSSLLAVDEGDVAVDEGRQLRAVGDDLLVGDGLGGIVGRTGGGLALQDRR